MVLYGASGHARVIRDILISEGKEIKAFFDDNKNINIFESLPVYRYDKNLFPDEELIISIGDNLARKRVSCKVFHRFGTSFHNSAIIGSFVKIEFGTVFMQGSIVQSNVQIGKHVIVNTSASVDHDCVINDFVHISPNATLCGNIIVGEGSHIGAGSTIIPGVKIGKWCTVGAGAVVVKDVPDYAVVVGNPARIIKYNNI